MTVSKTGLISWQVPADYTRAEERVILGVKDSTGQEVLQNISIFLPDAAAREQARIAAEAQRLKEEKLAQMQLARANENTQRLAKAPEALKTANNNIPFILEQLKPKAPVPPPEPIRSWVDADGNEMEARFVQMFGGVVTLRNAANKESLALLNSLSEDDQKYVRNLIDAAKAERKAREESSQSPEAQIQAPLRMIGAGVSTYGMQHRNFVGPYSLDAEKQPLLSWRVHILPYVGAGDLYLLFRMDEPWDSPHNKQLIQYMPECYRAVGSQADQGKTNFLAVVGNDCIFSPVAGKAHAGPPDGGQRTAMIVEAPDDQAVIWTKPDDHTLTDGKSLRSLIGLRSGGFNALFMDGKIHLVSGQNSDEVLVQLFNGSDGLPAEFKK
jgi:hypothetical protein